MQKIKDLIYYNRKEIIITTVFLIIFITYIFFNTNNSHEEIIENPIIEEKEIIEEIVVDIKGEINNPGTYKVTPDKRVTDVIELSGGLKEKADTSSINLSEKVYDEMLIIIPSEEEEKSITTSENNKTVKDSKISINTASESELTTISGIGTSKAKSIVDYRNKNGKFKSIEEITNVSGIGQATFEKIKDYIKV